MIDPKKLKALLKEEQKHFNKNHKTSKKHFQRAKISLLDGVPMHWMKKWAGGFPLFVQSAKGGHFLDADDNEFIDFCLGDTGAMMGHAPDAQVDFLHQQLQKGITYMLPNENAIYVGEELQKRFGLPYWQVAISATDANRFSLRLARHITKRPYVLVFNYCYHGTVDEAFITLENGVAKSRSSNIGAQIDPTQTSKVIEFNDLEALEEVLKNQDIAALLAEPVMTNIGIIHPNEGYWKEAQRLCKKYGTLLIIDETHTICTAPNGYTGKFHLEPDMFVIGKAIGNGVPTAVYGFSAEVAQRLDNTIPLADIDVGGIGGTLAGNALSIAAMRVTLEKLITPENFAYTLNLATQFNEGIQEVIDEFNLPWITKQLGCRTEYWFRKEAPVNGGEAAAACDFELDTYMHLFALNRGILMTPFHNMALICPNHSIIDVEKHSAIFRQAVQELL